MSNDPGIPGMDNQQVSGYVPQVQGNSVPPSTSDERNLALLAHLGALVSYFFGSWFLHIGIPGVIFAIKKDSSPYVRLHAAEATNFQITFTIFVAIATVVGLILAVASFGLMLVILIPLAIAVGIFGLVVMIKGSIAASRGEFYQYPFTIRFFS